MRKSVVARMLTWATVGVACVYMYTLGANLAFAGSCDDESGCEGYGEAKCEELEGAGWVPNGVYFMEEVFCEYWCFNEITLEAEEGSKSCIPV